MESYEPLEEETEEQDQIHGSSSLCTKISGFFNVCLLLSQAILLNAFICKYGEPWMSGIGITLSTVHFLLWVCLLPVIANKNNKAKNLLTVYWVCYGCLQWIPHICLIFTQLTHKFDNSSFFGQHTLEGTLCLSPLIFLTLIYASHHRIPEERHEFVEKLLLLVAIDLFDSVEILEFVYEFDHEGHSLPTSLLVVIVVLSCLNIVIPCIVLVELQRDRRHLPCEGKFFVIESILGLAFVNIPYMIIRGIFWVKYEQNISTFMAKNIYFAIAESREIAEYFVDAHNKRKD